MHLPGPEKRFTEPAALPADATPAQAMTHKLKTKAGRALYALRKQTVEPVFGIIKSVLGFRQFSLRGLKKVTGELAKAQHRLDDAEHGFDGLLAQGVERPPSFGFQLVRHGLGGRCIRWQRRRLGKAFLRPRKMHLQRLTANRI
jgi:hypothetical protein